MSGAAPSATSAEKVRVVRHVLTPPTDSAEALASLTAALSAPSLPSSSANTASLFTTDATTGVDVCEALEVLYYAPDAAGGELQQLWREPPDTLRPRPDGGGDTNGPLLAHDDADDAEEADALEPQAGSEGSARRRRNGAVKEYTTPAPPAARGNPSLSAHGQCLFTAAPLPDMRHYGVFLLSVPCEEGGAPGTAAPASVVHLRSSPAQRAADSVAWRRRLLEGAARAEHLLGQGHSPDSLGVSELRPRMLAGAHTDGAAAPISDKWRSAGGKVDLRSWRAMDNTGEVDAGGRYEGRWKLEEAEPERPVKQPKTEKTLDRRGAAVMSSRYREALSRLTGTPGRAPTAPPALPPSATAAHAASGASVTTTATAPAAATRPRPVASYFSDAPVTAAPLSAAAAPSVPAPQPPRQQQPQHPPEKAKPQEGGGATPSPAPAASDLARCGEEVLRELRVEGRTAATLKELERLVLKRLPDYAATAAKARDAATKKESVVWFQTRQRELQQWLLQVGCVVSPDGQVSLA